MSLNEDEQLYKCRELLSWFVGHRYLQHVDNTKGRQYQKLACLIEDGLSKLPVDYQRLLYYSYFEKHSGKGLMRLVGLSKTTLYVHKRTSIIMLADIIGDQVLQTWREELAIC